jgi:hypothetical protein
LFAQDSSSDRTIYATGESDNDFFHAEGWM